MNMGQPRFMSGTSRLQRNMLTCTVVPCKEKMKSVCHVTFPDNIQSVRYAEMATHAIKHG